jgi:hypothetical protein
MKRGLFSLVILSILTLVGCNPAVVQPVRVVEKNKTELNIGSTLSAVRVADIYNGYHNSLVIYPDIMLRYGVENGVDVGLRIWQIFGVIMDVKWQFLGDRTSTFASSVDFELGWSWSLFPYYLPDGGYLTGIPIVSGIAVGGDVMISEFLSVYLSSKLRFTFMANYDKYYPEPVIMDSGYLYSSRSYEPLMGLVSIDSLGLVVLPKNNFSVVAEFSLGISLLNNLTPVAFSVVPRIKF